MSVKDDIENLSGGKQGPAIRSLGKIGGDQAVEALLTLLASSQHYVQTEAIKTLADTGDVRAVEPILDVFHYGRTLGVFRILARRQPASDKFSYVRAAAVIALGKLGDERAVQPLIKALRKERGRPTSIGCYIMDALAAIGDARAVDVLALVLNDGGWDTWTNLSSAEVRDGLDSMKIKARAEAARALSRIGHQSALDALKKALRDGTDDVQHYAAEALEHVNERGSHKK